MDDQITPDQMDGMIAEIDTDGSGTVDFDGNLFFYVKVILALQCYTTSFIDKSTTAFFFNPVKSRNNLYSLLPFSKYRKFLLKS